MIALLKRTDFDPAEIDTDLHKMAIQDGYIKRFDMRVNRRDGDQDLSMWMLDIGEVVRKSWETSVSRGPRTSVLDSQVILRVQNEPPGYPRLSLAMHINYGISWDILV